jgi:hypothetical protein
MISGAHKKDLPIALNNSHYSIIIKPPLLKWALNSTRKNLYVVDSYAKAIKVIKKIENKIDIILIMSNKSTVNIRGYIKNDKNK